MFPRFLITGCACAAFIASLTVGCDTPFDSSTAGSNEGNTCDLKAPGECGTGLTCYVPPNCDVAVCCPPQDPSSPVCYCAAPATDTDAGDEAGDAASTATDAATADDNSTD